MRNPVRTSEPVQETVGDTPKLEIALPEEACTAVFDHDGGYATSVQNLSAVTLSLVLEPNPYLQSTRPTAFCRRPAHSDSPNRAMSQRRNSGP